MSELVTKELAGNMAFQERLDTVNMLIGTFEADLAHAEYKKDLLQQKVFELEKEIEICKNRMAGDGIMHFGRSLREMIADVTDKWKTGAPWYPPKNISGLRG